MHRRTEKQAYAVYEIPNKIAKNVYKECEVLCV